MICGRTLNLLDAYLDDELTGSDMLAIRRHLHSCPACEQQRRELNQVRSLMRALPPQTPALDSIVSVLDRAPAVLSQPPTFFAPFARVNWDRVAVLSVGGALALTLALAFANMGQPQAADTVVQRVPILVHPEDRLQPAAPVQILYGNPAERGWMNQSGVRFRSLNFGNDTGWPASQNQ